MKLDNKQKDVVALAKAGGTDKELVILDKIHGIEDEITALKENTPSLKDIVGSVKGIQGDPGKDGKDGKKGDKGDRGERGLTGPQGKPGADSKVPGPKGDTPSTEAIVSLIKPLIPDAVVVDEIALANNAAAKLEENLPAFGKAFRDALELLPDGEKLSPDAIEGLQQALEGIVKNVSPSIPGWGAHPLTIKQSGVTKAKVARVINFTGATVTLAPDGVITVAITGGSGWTIETPTGTVNSSNTSFTATATPVYIVVDGIQYFENNGYTLSGLNITTSVPPTGFIRSVHA